MNALEIAKLNVQVQISFGIILILFTLLLILFKLIFIEKQRKNNQKS